MIFKKIRTLSGLLVLVWLFGVIVFYYAGHKPFTPAVALNLTTTLWQIGAGLGIVALGGGVGAWLLSWIEAPALVRSALHAAFGLGLLSMGILLVGGTVGLNPAVLVGALLLFLVIFRHQVKYWIISWQEISAFWIKGQYLGRAISIATGMILIFTLINALGPPIKFDALVYHLVLPWRYLQDDRISYVPENMFWGMPQTAEMLFTWAMALAGPQGAIILEWFFGVLALAGILGFAGHHFGERNGWVAIAGLLAGSTLSASLAWGYVDWLVMFFGWAFFVCIPIWLDRGNQRYLLLAGAFAGLAAGTKYTAGILLFGGSVVLLLLRSTPRQKLRNFFHFSLAAGLFILPWALKNFLATGNPVYPFLFPSGAMDSIRLSWYQGQPAWGNWWEAAFLPLRASLWGYEGRPGFGASIGPLLLGLSILPWIIRRNEPAQRQAVINIATIISLSGLIAWAVASRLSLLLIQSRLYFGVFPAVAILCSAGFHALNKQRFQTIRIGRIGGALVLLALVLNVFETGASALTLGGPRMLLANRSRDEYLSDNLGWYYPAMQAIQDLPSDVRVLLLWEPRSFYCLPQCYPDEVLDRWVRDIRKYKRSDHVLESWQKEGYTHLLYYQLGSDFVRQDDNRLNAADWAALEALLSMLPPPEDIGGAYKLFSLQP